MSGGNGGNAGIGGSGDQGGMGGTGGVANARRIVENIGFKMITEIEDYWYKDSIVKDYICPSCGKPPCKCSMIFYRLEIPLNGIPGMCESDYPPLWER